MVTKSKMTQISKKPCQYAVSVLTGLLFAYSIFIVFKSKDFLNRLIKNFGYIRRKFQRGVISTILQFPNRLPPHSDHFCQFCLLKI